MSLDQDPTTKPDVNQPRFDETPDTSSPDFQTPVMPEGTDINDLGLKPEDFAAENEVTQPLTRAEARESKADTTPGFWTRGKKIGAWGIAGATVVTAAAALTVGAMLPKTDNAAGPDEDDETVQTPAPEVTATPSPEEEEPIEESPAPVENFDYDFGVDRQTVESYLSEDQNAFLSRPIEERVLVSMYFAQNMPDFADDWHSVTKNPLDILPSTLSVDNTPQEIVTIATYMNRMPYTLTLPDDYTLDVNAANKMFGGNLKAGAASDRYTTVTTAVQEFATAGGAAPSARTLAVSEYILMPKVESSSELLVDNSGYSYRTITFTEQAQTVTYTFTWVVTEDGAGMWVRN